MHKLTFRSATPRDLDHIMQLEAAGFAAAHRESRAVYAQRIEVFAAGALIASVGSEDVGCFFSEIWRASAQPCAEHFCLGHDIGERHDARHGDELYISSLALAPEWHGRGLGARLFGGGIDHVARAHPHVRSVLLLVNSGWQQARRIYAAAGFAQIARLAGFFAAGDAPAGDGIVMRRAIAPVVFADSSPPKDGASR